QRIQDCETNETREEKKLATDKYLQQNWRKFRMTATNNIWCELPTDRLRADSRAAANSTYKKLAVLWSNEALCFVSCSVHADSFVLRNRQLLLAANRCSEIPSG